MIRSTDRYGVFISVMIHIAANGKMFNKTWLAGNWPLCATWHHHCAVSFMCHVRACISLILDIRPPARPGVPPSWRAGGDKNTVVRIHGRCGSLIGSRTP